MDKLSDLEICKRIAEIEGYGYITENYYKIMVSCGNGYNDSKEEFNPLSSHRWQQGICFDLMVKYDVDVLSPYRKNGETKWEAQIFSKDYADAFSIYDESPNKAICLAIIEAHKE